jgi:hypothetical protein
MPRRKKFIKCLMKKTLWVQIIEVYNYSLTVVDNYEEHLNLLRMINYNSKLSVISKNMPDTYVGPYIAEISEKMGFAFNENDSDRLEMLWDREEAIYQDHMRILKERSEKLIKRNKTKKNLRKLKKVCGQAVLRLNLAGFSFMMGRLNTGVQVSQDLVLLSAISLLILV